MTKHEIVYVKNLASERTHIIEFGSGLSTLEWAGSFANVTSVETRSEWFHKIRSITERKYRNVELIFSPPESCAYGEKGEELWNSRTPSDYGLSSEFLGYIETSKSLINRYLHPCVIFIDANVRTEILEIALNSGIRHEILVHDVIPEREYLNTWITKHKEIIVGRIDSLVHLRQP
jgi:hypothetical protein